MYSTRALNGKFFEITIILNPKSINTSIYVFNGIFYIYSKRENYIIFSIHYIFKKYINFGKNKSILNYISIILQR